ncbi:DUF3483 domain-containing protein [Pseudomonas aeruginosa]|uniref:DUF3483 domain-containing protein n=1 Tax=Pseudomonas aeruginosa TaxID=287 RepID=UPI000650E27C|nr:DUF3483 domain-containing protein [Pseudomonas aeruginosa]
MLDTLLPVLLFAALALAVLGAAKRFLMWRRGRPAKVDWIGGLMQMPRRYLVDLHHVVERDRYMSRTHVATAGGFVLAALLAILVHGFGLHGRILGFALLAAGQSSTFTGTIAGQVVMEGFLRAKIPCWQRRLITRGLALVPALIGVLWLGEGAVGKLLVLSQVVLSLQLPFALWPLIRFSSDRGLMGEFVNPRWVSALAWSLFGLISAANLTLLYFWFG